jgi:hypothetical protein
MSDNWSGNSNLVRDGSDFVEASYFIMNGAGWNPALIAAMGAHIEGTDAEITSAPTFTSCNPVISLGHVGVVGRRRGRMSLCSIGTWIAIKR